jgi:probable F420-dependent oxidoreductase
MRVGVTFPHTEIGADPGVIREYAQAVEALGFAHLTAYDHVVGATARTGDARMDAWPAAAYAAGHDFHEPFVLFGFLAAATRTLELATGVLVLPQRQAVLVAKQAAEVAVLSGGRLRLGVGVGYNHLEYVALGEPWERRGRRLVEQMAVLRALWSQPVVDFAGEFHTLPSVGIDPRPERPIPLWMGAASPAGLRRAARHADGIFAALDARHPGVADWVEGVHTALEAAGRDRATFGLEGRVNLYGRDAGEVAEDIAAWERMGADRVTLNAMAPPDRRDRPWTVGRQLEALALAVQPVGR